MHMYVLFYKNKIKRETVENDKEFSSFGFLRRPFRLDYQTKIRVIKIFSISNADIELR